MEDTYLFYVVNIAMTVHGTLLDGSILWLCLNNGALAIENIEQRLNLLGLVYMFLKSSLSGPSFFIIKWKNGVCNKMLKLKMFALVLANKGNKEMGTRYDSIAT